MPTRPAAPEFQPGFRLNVFDVAVLLMGLGAAWYAMSAQSLPAAIPAYVIGTFFLYCNVFRIRRSAELLWALVFTTSALASSYGELPSWPMTFGIGCSLTVVLVLRDMRHPSYHGILWQRVNPQLMRWWQQQRGQPTEGSAGRDR